jgi:ketopantoate hydroxymethyltransferase
MYARKIPENIDEDIAFPKLGFRASPECQRQALVTVCICGLFSGSISEYQKKYIARSVQVKKNTREGRKEMRSRVFRSEQYCSGPEKCHNKCLLPGAPVLRFDAPQRGCLFFGPGFTEIS